MNLKQIVFMNVMISIVFSATMGFFMLLINVGLVPGFFVMWLKSVGTGLVIGMPLSFIFVPPIQRLSMRLFAGKKQTGEKSRE
ncbi:MAG TPA: DUF2798 domain-containing protein [Firmicutes bacterium]|nr:DUF2798 domain-containing protein [Bacillota bacterium]